MAPARMGLHTPRLKVGDTIKTRPGGLLQPDTDDPTGKGLVFAP